MSTILFDTNISSTCSDDIMDRDNLEDDIITDDEATLEDEDEEQLDGKGEDEEWLVLSNSEDEDSDDAVASPKEDVAKETELKARATETLMVQDKTSPIDLLVEHTDVNVVEQVEPSIPEPKATETESEPKNWTEHFAIELPKIDFELPKIDFELPTIDFDFGSVKQWVDMKKFKSWLTTKNVQTLIICLLVSLLTKQRYALTKQRRVASRSTTTILQDNEVIQRLQQRLVELQSSNEKYASELTLSGLDRTTWSNMAIKCDSELSELQTLHQELEDSIQAPKLLAPVDYPTAAHFQDEHRAPMGNASQPGDEISLMPCARSHKAIVVAGSTSWTRV